MPLCVPLCCKGPLGFLWLSGTVIAREEKQNKLPIYRERGVPMDRQVRVWWRSRRWTILQSENGTGFYERLAKDGWAGRFFERERYGDKSWKPGQVNGARKVGWSVCMLGKLLLDTRWIVGEMTDWWHSLFHHGEALDQAATGAVESLEEGPADEVGGTKNCIIVLRQSLMVGIEVVQVRTKYLYICMSR